MKIIRPEWISSTKITPEWVTAISTLILMVATIALVFIGYGAAENWKQERRYEAFQSYKEKLTKKENAAFDVVTVINTLNNSKVEDKKNQAYFKIFKNRLREQCLKYLDVSMSTKNDTFLFFLNADVNEAINKMIQVDTEFIELLKPIDTFSNSNEVKYNELNKKYNELIMAIENVIFESAKSIKTKETIK